MFVAACPFSLYYDVCALKSAIMAAAHPTFSILERYKDILITSEVPIKTSFITILVYGFKEFLHQIVFECPRDYNKLYAALFICGPSIILFCLSMLISESFWVLVTGCCRFQSRKRKLVWWKSRNSIYFSLLSPCLWLVFAFMQGDYYVCLMLGPIEAAQEKTVDLNIRTAIDHHFDSAKTFSVIVAWLMLIILTTVITIFVTLTRLYARIDPKLLGEIDFDEVEAQEAVLLWNERLQRLAKVQALEVIEEVSNSFKDSNLSDQIRLGEEYLKELYPKFGGIVSGQYRNNDSARRHNRFGNFQLHVQGKRSSSMELLLKNKRVSEYGVRDTSSV